MNCQPSSQRSEEANVTVAQLAGILIVDHEKDICELLFRLVEKASFLSTVANDRETALDVIRRQMPQE